MYEHVKLYEIPLTHHGPSLILKLMQGLSVWHVQSSLIRAYIRAQISGNYLVHGVLQTS